MFKRLLALLMALSASLSLSACNNNNQNAALSGNLGDLSSEPGDIFAVFEFLDYGEVTFKLFPEIAPVAVETFCELAERGYYTKRNIHRVLHDYFFQGGSVIFDGTDGTVQKEEYFDIETSDYARHFYGALCFAANDNGKNYRQFYIVCKNTPEDIDTDIEKLETQLNDTTRVLTDEAKTKYTNYLNELKAIPDNIKELYLSRGGVYSLDGKNTVFGQVTEGQAVIDAIAKAVVVSGNAIDDINNIESKPLDEIILEKVTIVRIPLPEPTTVSSEESTKKTKKTTTTADPNSAEALTDKVNFGEETTATGEAVDTEESSSDTEADETADTTETYETEETAATVADTENTEPAEVSNTG